MDAVSSVSLVSNIKLKLKTLSSEVFYFWWETLKMCEPERLKLDTSEYNKSN